MNFLFIHQNFPGQFKHLAPALVSRGHRVVAIPLKGGEPRVESGVEIRPYTANRGTSEKIHPWVQDFETKIIRAENCLKHCQRLSEEGFKPDVIIAHPGWGETLFLQELWPDVPMGMYCEFYYHARGSDNDFDPEFSRKGQGLDERCRIRLKNLNPDWYLAQMSKGICPTQWQASVFPTKTRSDIEVIHDGIDSVKLCPNPNIQVTFSEGHKLSRNDEVITFVSRNLEPHRGFHTFMRALPNLLASRPSARILIIGEDAKGYGAAPPEGGTWRKFLEDELHASEPNIDWSRVWFLGRLPYDKFVAVLQLSRVHVYLTYPFVASWSLLEAMSVGAAIVASDTPPVLEFVTDNQNGVLTDFFDQDALVRHVCRLLDNPDLRHRLGTAARSSVIDRYDLKTVCLPKQLAWCESLLARNEAVTGE